MITEQGELIQCTISMGVVTSDETIKNLDVLLTQADKLLYMAKGSGQNKTIFRI